MEQKQKDFRKKVIRRVGLMLLLLAIINAYGTIGIWLLEGSSLMDSFYMSVITLTTVGFAEVVNLSEGGRLFAITLIYAGLAGSGISVAMITSLLFEDTISDVLEGTRMQRKINNLSNHYIVCGFGNTGRQVSEELTQTGKTVVVIDMDSKPEQDAANLYHLPGDARQDEVLEKAGIKRAAGLASTLTEDSDNVFVVLTARALNPDLVITSRYKDDDTEKKLFTAGANYAVSPYRMGGHRMMLSLTTPSMAALMDATHPESTLNVHFTHVPVPPEAPINGRLLSETHIRDKSLGALVVAVVDKAGNTTFNPSPDFRLDNIRELLILGDTEQINSLKTYLMTNS